MTATVRLGKDATHSRLARGLGRLASKWRGGARRQELHNHAARPNPAVADAHLRSGSLRAIYVSHKQARTECSAQDAADRGGHALQRALSDPDPLRRMSALEVVCRFSDEHGAELLVRMLGDLDPTVRRAAASSAARLASPRVVSRLITALGDPDPEVCRACQKALETIMASPIEAVDCLDAERRGRLIAELTRRWKLQRLAELCAAAHAQSSA